MRFRRAASIAGVIAALGTPVLFQACGGASIASEDQLAVCAELQVMIDELVVGDGPGALQSLDGLAAAVEEAGQGPVQESGDAFLRAIGDTVPDPGALTIAETKAVGDRVLAESEAGLAGMINGCAEVGRPIENLPT